MSNKGKNDFKEETERGFLNWWLSFYSSDSTSLDVSVVPW